MWRLIKEKRSLRPYYIVVKMVLGHPPTAAQLPNTISAIELAPNMVQIWKILSRLISMYFPNAATYGIS